MEINSEHCLIHKCWFILKHATTFFLLFRRKTRNLYALLIVERTPLTGWNQEDPKDCPDCALPPSLMLNGFVLFEPKRFPSTTTDISRFSRRPFHLSLFCPSWIFTVTVCFSCLRGSRVIPLGPSAGCSLGCFSQNTDPGLVAQMLSNPCFPSLPPGASGRLFWKRVRQRKKAFLPWRPVAPAFSCLCQVIRNIWSMIGCRCCRL